MKNSNIFLPALLLVAHLLGAQETVSPLFPANHAPDSIIQITTVLPGATHAQTLTVEVFGGWASVEGDIVLGRIEELQQMAEDRGAVVDGNQFRWPGGNIPYLINAGFTSQYVNLLRQGIDYINGATHLNLRPFTPGDTRWVVFNPSDVCQSAVGMQSSGGQVIKFKDPFLAVNAGVGCYFPEIIHEIAHAAGLWHEQSREDRNTWVTIQWGNIQAGKEHNFNQHISDGTDIGSYDFASVMHYDRFAFSKNGQATITANGGQTFGTATEYSAGDLAAINWMYPTNACQAVFNTAADLVPVARPLHFETSTTVYAQHKIPTGNQVIFDAGQSLTFAPGFQATLGCTFRAVIDGCGGTVQSLASPEEEEWMLEAGYQKPDPGATESSAPVGTAAKIAQESAAFHVAPNPFLSSTTVTYTLPQDRPVTMQLFNLTGQLLATPLAHQIQPAGQYEQRLDLSAFSAGIYLLVVRTGEKTSTQRIVRM